MWIVHETVQLREFGGLRYSPAASLKTLQKKNPKRLWLIWVQEVMYMYFQNLDDAPLASLRIWEIQDGVQYGRWKCLKS